MAGEGPLDFYDAAQYDGIFIDVLQAQLLYVQSKRIGRTWPSHNYGLEQEHMNQYTLAGD